MCSTSGGNESNIVLEVNNIPSALFSNSIYPDQARHNITIMKGDYTIPEAGPILESSPTIENIQKYRGAQIVHHEIWDDSHLNLFYQDKYVKLYSKHRLSRLKPESNIRKCKTTKEVYEQLHREGSEVLAAMEADEANNDY
ncbi:hypothetical protein ACLB2K_004735 [Fragaria x ananassa]